MSAEEMDLVLDFVRRYAQADYETEVALYTERDQNAYLVRVRDLETFFADGVSTGHSASLPKWTDAEREPFTAKAARIRPRTVFKLKQRTHPEEGTIYQAFLGDTSPARRTAYGSSYFIKKHDNDCRIFAIYTICLACFATGQLDGKACPDCRGAGWSYLRGTQLASFGTSEATRRLEAPTLPQLEADYNSD